MLSTLYIENIAVIEKTNIEFSKGLNVLTGETGAGKSIIIDSINAVTGHRTSKDIIRTGSESAFVSATFTCVDSNILKKAEEMGFKSDDGTLILSRELSLNGRSVCRINERPTTVTTLKELGINLINIHGQHESLELMQSDSHINYIDNFADIAKEKEDYYTSYKEEKDTNWDPWKYIGKDPFYVKIGDEGFDYTGSTAMSDKVYQHQSTTDNKTHTCKPTITTTDSSIKKDSSASKSSTTVSMKSELDFPYYKET